MNLCHMEEAQFPGLPSGSGQLAANDSSSSGQDVEHPQYWLKQGTEVLCPVITETGVIKPPPSPFSSSVYLVLKLATKEWCLTMD